ncbi:MAG: type III pantothenate kinase [Bacteroidetes bacterium]|nr:type III pantothenate kinase [Bacteroidota bacterium]MCY4206078.1 type III pantothenate kinase [Bacteroidota bacterium]
MSRSAWLTIDIGNSALKAGLFLGDQLIQTSNLQAIEEVSELIATWNSKTPFERIGLCSVVPQNSELVISKIRQFGNVPIFEMNSHSTLPLQVRYTPPESLGADRLAAACSAWHPGGISQIIIDAGTAITIDVVSADGVFMGGVIMPGPSLTRRALADYTANLPKVSLHSPNGVIGSSTAEAIQHGLINGLIDGVLGIVSRIRESLDSSPVITLTGGWHQLLADKIPGVQLNRDLVLHGIKLLMQLNTESSKS